MSEFKLNKINHHDTACGTVVQVVVNIEKSCWELCMLVSLRKETSE